MDSGTKRKSDLLRRRRGDASALSLQKREYCGNFDQPAGVALGRRNSRKREPRCTRKRKEFEKKLEELRGRLCIRKDWVKEKGLRSDRDRSLTGSSLAELDDDLDVVGPARARTRSPRVARASSPGARARSAVEHMDRKAPLLGEERGERARWARPRSRERCAVPSVQNWSWPQTVEMDP